MSLFGSRQIGNFGPTAFTAPLVFMVMGNCPLECVKLDFHLQATLIMRLYLINSVDR